MTTKIAIKQLSQEVIDLINAGGRGTLLRDIISNVAVGAAPVGTKFPQGQDLTILRKYCVEVTFKEAGNYKVNHLDSIT